MNYITKENNVFESYTNTNLIRSFSNNEWDLKWSGTQIEIARMDDNKIISREWVNINHNEETNTFKSKLRNEVKKSGHGSGSQYTNEFINYFMGYKPYFLSQEENIVEKDSSEVKSEAKDLDNVRIDNCVNGSDFGVYISK